MNIIKEHVKFTKIMVIITLCVLMLYAGVLRSAIDIYSIPNKDNTASTQVFVIRNGGDPNGTFNTVLPVINNE